jgi:hypothetical protein
MKATEIYRREHADAGKRPYARAAMGSVVVAFAVDEERGDEETGGGEANERNGESDHSSRRRTSGLASKA